MSDCEEEHCVKAEIKTDPSSDIRELLFYQLAEKNLPILCHAACGDCHWKISSSN